MIPTHFLPSSKIILPAGIVGMLGVAQLTVVAAKVPQVDVLEVLWYQGHSMRHTNTQKQDGLFSCFNKKRASLQGKSQCVCGTSD